MGDLIAGRFTGPDGQDFHLGWRPDLEGPAKERWAREGSPPRFTAATFAAAADPEHDAFTLADLVSWWFNQADLGSCFANATPQVVQVAEAFAARRLGLPVDDTKELSRRATWYYGRQLDGLLGSRSDGGSVTNALRSFHQFGCPPDALWPYKPDHAWCEATPPASVVAAAKPYGLAGLLDLDFGDSAAIERAIVAGQPPAIGIWWPYGWDQGQIDQYGRTAGIGSGVFGHALALIGYVRPGVWDKYRWWHIVNSHGPIYPLPSAEMRAKVVGYASARPDRCYAFWVRDDLLQRVAGYGNQEMVAPVGPFAPDPRSPASWDGAFS